MYGLRDHSEVKIWIWDDENFQLLINYCLPSNEVKLAETRGFIYERMIGEGGTSFSLLISGTGLAYQNLTRSVNHFLDSLFDYIILLVSC